MGDERVVAGPRRSGCITYEVLGEVSGETRKRARSIELEWEYVLGRYRCACGKGIIVMRKRRVKLAVACGYGVATGARNYGQAEKEALAVRNK